MNSSTQQSLQYTAIELFAGAGGLALGLENAGFGTIALVEQDHDACCTLRQNRPQWNIIEQDISAVTAVPDLCSYFNVQQYTLDLLSGGAPCQAFSYAGRKLGLADTRGTLFYHYAAILNQLKPKVFLFENVRGLLSHDHGRTFKTICSVFAECGYAVQYKVLNANDYNTAQKRERLIMLGIRKDLTDVLHIEYPEPHTYKPVLRDVLQNVPYSPCAKYSERKKQLFSMIPPGGNWKDLPEDIARDYMQASWDSGGGSTGVLRRLSMDEPAPTILTAPQWKRTERCHPAEIRPLSVRECARIQTFPDSWAFCGSMMSQYKQIGNAVPVNLAYAVGKAIAEGLDQMNQLNNCDSTAD